MIYSSFRRHAVALILSLAALPAAMPCRAQSGAWDDGSVPFVVSPDEVVERMLRIADVGAADTLIDLGSGDGRIVVGAAKRGARALGIEIDPQLVERARARAAAAGVAGRAEFAKQDLFDADLSAATVITMYLLPEVNLQLRPRLLALRPGTRVVSHDWDMADWEPDETIELRAPEKSVGLGGKSRVFLWIVPGDAHGRWRSEIPGEGGAWTFDIGQKFQALTIEVQAGGAHQGVRASRLRGSEIKMLVAGQVGGRASEHLFSGIIRGDRIVGELQYSDGEGRRTIPWTATRSR